MTETVTLAGRAPSAALSCRRAPAPTPPPLLLLLLLLLLPAVPLLLLLLAVVRASPRPRMERSTMCCMGKGDALRPRVY